MSRRTTVRVASRSSPAPLLPLLRLRQLRLSPWSHPDPSFLLRLHLPRAPSPPSTTLIHPQNRLPHHRPILNRRRPHRQSREPHRRKKMMIPQRGVPSKVASSRVARYPHPRSLQSFHPSRSRLLRSGCPAVNPLRSPRPRNGRFSLRLALSRPLVFTFDSRRSSLIASALYSSALHVSATGSPWYFPLPLFFSSFLSCYPWLTAYRFIYGSPSSYFRS